MCARDALEVFDASADRKVGKSMNMAFAFLLQSSMQRRRLVMFLPIILMFGILYLLMILRSRPGKRNGRRC